MFTGLVQDVGEVVALDKTGDWVLTIKTPLSLEKTAIGASIACNGICLTVIEKHEDRFKVQVSLETLSKTTAVHWKQGTRINLEPALRMGDELGGHLMSGHVDGVVRVVDRVTVGDSLRLVFDVPKELVKFIAPKGSVSLDGVSLTINNVDSARFDVNLIPHTQTATNLADLVVGDEVNIEVDMIARYVERMMKDFS